MDPKQASLLGALFIAAACSAWEGLIRREGWRTSLLRTAVAAAAAVVAGCAVAVVAGRIPAMGNPIGGWKYVWGAGASAFSLVRCSSSIWLRPPADPLPSGAPLVLFALIVLAGAAPWLTMHTIGGDDIWYVLMAFSLADDGDVRIDDEMAAAAYRRWIYVRGGEREFLAGLSVGDAFPSRLKYFSGASVLLAPSAALIQAAPSLPPWASRLLLGLPGWIAGAAVFGLLDACMRGWLPAADGRRKAVLALLLFATPIPFWFQSLSPEAFLPLASMAAVWSALAASGAAGRAAGVAGWAAMPWLHPRVMPSALLGALLLPPRGGSRLAGVAAAGASTAMKVALDAATGTGLFAGYAGDAGYAVRSPAAFLSALLGPWVGADTAFLLYAPVLAVGLAGASTALFDRAAPPTARPIALWVLAQMLLLGLTTAWHGVTGVGRLFVDVLYPLALLGVLARGMGRGEVGALAVLGGAWNLLFMAVPLLWFYLPSGSLARYLHLDLAWILPEFGGEAAHFRHRWPSPWIPALWTLPLAAWWIRRLALPRGGARP